MARKERTHPRIQNQVSIRTNGRKEKFLLTTQIKQKCPLHKNVRRLYVIHCQMYVTRLKSFLLSYFVINLVISNMCFACAVGNWPSCNNTVGRKMRIVACHNRCNSKPMGAFNTTKIPVEMLEIPLAQWNYIDPSKASARLVTVPTNGKGHSNIADLNLNSSDLAGS